MGKVNCEAVLDTNEDGSRDLVVRIPFDQSSIEANLDNCSREKNSVTLVNGDIVREAGRRGNIAFFLDTAYGRVELKGGVNIYVTRPATAGRGRSETARREDRAITAAIEEENSKWAILPHPLISPNGDIVRKEGDRILKEVLGEFMATGYQYFKEESLQPVAM